MVGQPRGGHGLHSWIEGQSDKGAIPIPYS